MPEILVVGGANGAGKSTFASVFLADNPHFFFLNADEIARELRPENLYEARFDAGRQFLERLEETRRAGTDIVLESTLSGLTLARHLDAFRQAGYQVRLVYVFLNMPAESVNRVSARVLAGGHYVPPVDVVRRFGRSQHNFWFTYRQLASRWNLISNSGDTFTEVAALEDGNLAIFDDDAFWAFVLSLEPTYLLP